MSSEVTEERSDVHCLSAILSEHDFESVGGASGLEGFRRTVPSSEKKPLPCKVGTSRAIIVSGLEVWKPESELGEVFKTSPTAPFDVRGMSQGVESSWAAIVSSMLASPPIELSKASKVMNLRA